MAANAQFHISKPKEYVSVMDFFCYNHLSDLMQIVVSGEL